MDYTECLRVHGYIADKTESENCNVEEIYNKYKPPPVPYDQFKHRVVTIYADSNITSSSSNTFPTATQTTNSSATVQRNTSTRPVSNANSMLQQQLDQFINSYQQRTNTPIRDILGQPNTARGRTRARERAPGRERARVQTPPAPPPRAAVVSAQPASGVYTLTPPAVNIPVHDTWTERRVAVHCEPTRPPSSSTDVQVPYQPLVSLESPTHQPTRRHSRPRRQQQQEEETNNCCCCIC